MYRLVSGAVLSALILSGCATKPEEIAPAYVSTTGYEQMSCDQLRAEAEGVSNRARTAAGVQEDNANRDAAMVGVGVVLFWPALFFMKGDGAQAAEVARLKGEMQAIEQVNARKSCGIRFG